MTIAPFALSSTLTVFLTLVYLAENRMDTREPRQGMSTGSLLCCHIIAIIIYICMLLYSLQCILECVTWLNSWITLAARIIFPQVVLK